MGYSRDGITKQLEQARIDYKEILEIHKVNPDDECVTGELDFLLKKKQKLINIMVNMGWE